MDSFLQALGAGCVLMIAVAYLAGAAHLFPFMGWGMEHSAGHYTDCLSAVLGLILFSVGYLLHAPWFKPWVGFGQGT